MTDHDSRSKQLSNSTSNKENNNIGKRQTFVGKDKSTIWTTSKINSQGRCAANNIITNLSGATKLARNCSTPLQCWDIFFTKEIVDTIVECTNVQLNHFRTSRKDKCINTTNIEIRALFGILYMAGIYKQCHININDLWAKSPLTPSFFRMCMSKHRFKLLMKEKALRFDNVDNRDKRKKFDKLAPIREIFEMFTKNCRSSYVPSEYLTIDEMLEAFRGRCSIKQYIPSKPNKYGIKIFALSDARTFYTINMEIYAGKQPKVLFK